MVTIQRLLLGISHSLNIELLWLLSFSETSLLLLLDVVWLLNLHIPLIIAVRLGIHSSSLLELRHWLGLLLLLLLNGVHVGACRSLHRSLLHKWLAHLARLHIIRGPGILNPSVSLCPLLHLILWRRHDLLLDYNRINTSIKLALILRPSSCWLVPDEASIHG